MLASQMYRAARSLEAIENYDKADSFSLQNLEHNAGDLAYPESPPYPESIYSDEEFWKGILKSPQSFWEDRFKFYRFTICSWVARVPGLFWTKGAANLRKVKPEAIEFKSPDWVVLRPQGKSEQVFGGIGTIKLPPNEQGFRLAMLSSGYNASSGIPALISPDVWDGNDLGDGSTIDWVTAKWRPMPGGWAERFPSIKGIPKGCLIITSSKQLDGVGNHRAPVQFHPYTVMEYEQGNARLYDFVYATADTGMKNYRRDLETFFDEYKNVHNRYGRYLLSADISDPLWEAEYLSPAELMRTETGAKSQLELIQSRIRGECYNNQSLESIIEILNLNYDIRGLQRISNMIKVPPALWYAGGAVAAASVDLLNKCVERKKVEELVDQIALDYPESFA